MKTYEYSAPFSGLVSYWECDNCGDELWAHEWVKTNEAGLEFPIVACDRV